MKIMRSNNNFYSDLFDITEDTENETPTTYIERNGVYYQVPIWIAKEIKAFEVLKMHIFLRESTDDGSMTIIQTFDITDENEKQILKEVIRK